ncbi:mechanosensitive ion channel family protein [Desulfogranum mediterraneum]|uniref:mechanosensitive ion channel family protein n=1 Tax=Desulfogranum mediterraneum TaxID=160661 RepID=UPI000491E2E3|nr:mechanosensitive ion channel family protein [Desulfogranum mediterraneum]
MIRRLVLLLTLMLAAPVTAAVDYPLEQADTSSPRATLASFLEYSDRYARAMRDPDTRPRALTAARERAIDCFDLSKVAPSIANDVGLESILRLREILDRLTLPAMAEVPDRKMVNKQGLVRWRLPHTEIMIAKVAAGPRVGAYLFTPETLAHLDEYFLKVQHLPYRDGAVQGIYEEYIYSSGWMIPDGMIGELPDWMRRGYLGQAIWQWFGMIFILLAALSLLALLLRSYLHWKRKGQEGGWHLGVIFFPLLAMAICWTAEYIIDTQVNITGRVLTVTTMWLGASFLLFLAWGIMVAGNVVMHGIIASRHIKEETLSADFTKLLCRMGSFGLVFLLFYRAGSYFGLPVSAVFASAGIAGVAVALAARETLANFFGGISILMDRPFKAGDYIVLDSGERGEVKAVGMRSTRLLTRDDILITIPNSVITNVKIVNQSAPYSHFRVRIKIGVAYGSDLDQVEAILVNTARNNPLVMATPAPRARLRRFNDSAIDFELLVWAKQPHERGKLTHELSKQIYKRFNEAGVNIPYPQREVRLL